MSGKTVEVESLRAASDALNFYYSQLEFKVSNLRKYMEDCRQNMDNDEYSKKAFENLEDGLKKIGDAVIKAKDIEVRIIRKIEEIEQSKNILN